MKYIYSIAALALAACTVATSVGTAPLGPDPVISGGDYSTGGGLIVAVDIRENRGRTQVCGIWAEGAGQASLTLGPKAEVLGSGSVTLGDSVLVRGLGFFRQVPRAASYTGAEAGCVLTARPWMPGDDTRHPVVRFPKKYLHIDADDMGHEMVEFFPHRADG